MALIIPAVLGGTFTEIGIKIKRLEGRVPWIQLDVADGLFAPKTVWQDPTNLNEIGGQIRIEAHLMIERPENSLQSWMKVADRILIHYEAADNLNSIIDAGTGSTVEIGVVLGLETPIDVLDRVQPLPRHIQLMGIRNIGRAGEPLDPKVIEKVTALRARRPEVVIAVDGGVGPDNAQALVAAGADVLVVNSAIWNAADPETALARLEELVK